MEQIQTLLMNKFHNHVNLECSEYIVEKKHFLLLNVKDIETGKYLKGGIYSYDNLQYYPINALYIENIPYYGLAGVNEKWQIQKIEYDISSDSFQFVD